MHGPDNPLDEVLGRWLTPEQLRDEVPFDAAAVVFGRQRADQVRLLRELDAAVAQVTHSWEGGSGWSLGELPADVDACYVPDGPRLGRRVAHGGLFADVVVTTARRQREYEVLWPTLGVSLTELLDPTPPARGALFEDGLFSTDLRREGDPLPILEMNEEMEAYFEQQDREFEQAHEAARRAADKDLGGECVEVLRYAWSIQRGVQEGWLVLVDGGVLSTDNIKAMTRHAPYRAALESLLPHVPMDVWRTVLNSYGLGRELGRNRVATLPGDPEEADLVALTARFFHEVDYGGTLVGSPGSAAYIEPKDYTNADLPGWFDELVVALGSFTDHLDARSVAELRRNGVRDELRHWLQVDLNRVAQAASTGDDGEAELRTAARSLTRLAGTAHRAIEEAVSATFRNRLRQAGLWGSNGLVTGLLGATVTGSPTGVVAGAATIGFVVSATTGALAAGTVPPDTPEQVLVRLHQSTAPKGPIQAKHRRLLPEG